jgi:hypothetical protein
MFNLFSYVLAFSLNVGVQGIEPYYTMIEILYQWKQFHNAHEEKVSHALFVVRVFLIN